MHKFTTCRVWLCFFFYLRLGFDIAASMHDDHYVIGDWSTGVPKHDITDNEVARQRQALVGVKTKSTSTTKSVGTQSTHGIFLDRTASNHVPKGIPTKNKREPPPNSPPSRIGTENNTDRRTKRPLPASVPRAPSLLPSSISARATPTATNNNSNNIHRRQPPLPHPLAPTTRIVAKSSSSNAKGMMFAKKEQTITGKMMTRTNGGGGGHKNIFMKTKQTTKSRSSSRMKQNPTMKMKSNRSKRNRPAMMPMMMKRKDKTDDALRSPARLPKGAKARNQYYNRYKGESMLGHRGSNIMSRGYMKTVTQANGQQPPQSRGSMLPMTPTKGGPFVPKVSKLKAKRTIDSSSSSSSSSSKRKRKRNPVVKRTRTRRMHNHHRRKKTPNNSSSEYTMKSKTNHLFVLPSAVYSKAMTAMSKGKPLPWVKQKTMSVPKRKYKSRKMTDTSKKSSVSSKVMGKQVFLKKTATEGMHIKGFVKKKVLKNGVSKMPKAVLG